MLSFCYSRLILHTGIIFVICYTNPFVFQGQFCGRPEISADQREKYLQRLQQVQQQGSLLNVSHITGISQKQFPSQQPNPLLQQVLHAVII